MPFKKGNNLWKKSHASRAENTDRLQEFLLEMRSGGTDAYSDLLIALADGKELTKPQQEFMDRFEGWREFLTAKLARTELLGKDGKDLFMDSEQASTIALIYANTQSLRDATCGDNASQK